MRLTDAGPRRYPTQISERRCPTGLSMGTPGASVALDRYSGGPLGWRPARRVRLEGNVVFELRGGLGDCERTVAGLSAAGVGPALDVDAVELEGDALLAGAGRVLTRLEASGEADGLALDEVFAGGPCLGLPDDQVDVDGSPSGGIAESSSGARRCCQRQSVRTSRSESRSDGVDSVWRAQLPGLSCGFGRPVRVPDVVYELLVTERALDKLGARGISSDEVGQLPRNPHVTVRNPHGEALGRRRLLIGRTDGGRVLTLVIERTVDPTTWVLVTGWSATLAERRIFRS